MKLHTYDKNAERKFRNPLSHEVFKKTQNFSKSFRPAFSVSPFLVMLAGEQSRFNDAKQVYVHKEFAVTELFHA
jgi:hypothetical protein